MISLNDWISIITHIYTIHFLCLWAGLWNNEHDTLYVIQFFEVWVKLLIQRSHLSFEQTSGNTSYFNLVVGLNFELAMSVNGEIT
jgi:hypothetical protein